MSFGEHPQIAIAITVSQWCAHIPGNEWRAGDVMKWCAHTEKKREETAHQFFSTEQVQTFLRLRESVSLYKSHVSCTSPNTSYTPKSWKCIIYN